MRNDDKSYLEIKITFHHILVLLIGVILIGTFLFYLGYQAGKSAGKNPGLKGGMNKGNGAVKEINLVDKKDPDQLVKSGNRSIKDEMSLHKKQAGGDATTRSEVKTSKAAKKQQYFTIQVAAFNSHTLAKDYSKRFSQAGYPTSITQATVKGQIWYRVRVGNFRTKEAAIKEKQKLELLEKKKFAVIKAQ